MDYYNVLVKDFCSVQKIPDVEMLCCTNNGFDRCTYERGQNNIIWPVILLYC